MVKGVVSGNCVNSDKYSYVITGETYCISAVS